MRKLFLLALICGLTGCENDPQTTSSTTNPEVSIDLLFEHDDCKVYRFYDNRFHYFVKCKNAQDVTTINQHSESCGNNCIETVDRNIDTIGTE